MSFVPRINESINILNSERPSAIIELVKRVANKSNKVICNPISIGSRAFVIGVSDVRESGNDYTDWRFKTYHPDFYAMYYERWKPLDKDIYYLDRIYFHIYKIDYSSGILREYILLHCDASEPDDTEHSEYKKIPHLHISCSPQPVPHSHFSLFNGHDNHVLSSIQNLNDSIGRSIMMIENQVILPQII